MLVVEVHDAYSSIGDMTTTVDQSVLSMREFLDIETHGRFRLELITVDRSIRACSLKIGSNYTMMTRFSLSVVFYAN